MKKMNFPHRYVAQITIEALTPLAVGSDSLYYDQDSPVDKDFNNLPYIPGTAITGFLRKQIESALFGDKPDDNNEVSKGSNIIISDAFLMDENGEVKQQPQDITSGFLKQYFTLPIRQHTAINEYGAADDGSKFDTEVVFKGSRFKFEIELQVADENENWETILGKFLNNNFYLGAGEFNNFGEMEVVKIKQKYFDLSKKEDLNAYLDHDVDLNENKKLTDYNEIDKINIEPFYKTEKIELSGKNSFFHFGAGYGDDKVDNVNYTEWVIEWSDDNKPTFVEKYVIPGTSIKGALAHRVAYHYNKVNKNWVEKLIPSFKEAVAENLNKKFKLSDFKLADTLPELEKQKHQLEEQLRALEKEEQNTVILFDKYLGNNNKGVTELFGIAKDEDTGKTGTVIVKDIYLPINTPQTIFMHNKIDRYTGGTIESALFNEKVLAIDEVTLCIKSKEEISEKIDTTKYLEMALNDLKNGMLPLGGLVNKGHGIFVELVKNKKWKQ